jgi:hypothetical protein
MIGGAGGITTDAAWVGAGGNGGGYAKPTDDLDGSNGLPSESETMGNGAGGTGGIGRYIIRDGYSCPYSIVSCGGGGGGGKVNLSGSDTNGNNGGSGLLSTNGDGYIKIYRMW